MAVYYNEFDPKAAAWLRELIKAGLIADGEVDERSIIDVQARDVRGFDQCHWFAGIGGWSYALRLAGIPDEYPVWTASLPCQPFSSAGKQLGKNDERHLLPHYIDLVKQCRPATQFGEQVASAIKYGWACDLQAAMEAEGYSVGYHVLGAHSVGSFHQRQRLYWVANSNNKGLEGRQGAECTDKQLTGTDGLAYRLGNSENGSPFNIFGAMGGQKQTMQRQAWKRDGETARATSGSSCMGIADIDGCKSGSKTTEAARYRNPADSAGWANPEWIECRDNKLRPIKSGLEPLANGVPARVVRLRGYGNAIVPQVAAEFISGFFEVVA